MPRADRALKACPTWFENAVGKYVQDPRALDKESDVTEGELNDLINVAVQRTKEKYSSLTEGELREIINDAVQKTKEKYSGITAGQFNDMVNCGVDALKKKLGK